MDWTKIRRKVVGADKPPGAYTNLEDLIRIQFKTRDFSFLPKQPVTSVLSGRYVNLASDKQRSEYLQDGDVKGYTSYGKTNILLIQRKVVRHGL